VLGEIEAAIRQEWEEKVTEEVDASHRCPEAPSARLALESKVFRTTLGYDSRHLAPRSSNVGLDLRLVSFLLCSFCIEIMDDGKMEDEEKSRREERDPRDRQYFSCLRCFFFWLQVGVGALRRLTSSCFLSCSNRSGKEAS
jgi:hypothetical protein